MARFLKSKKEAIGISPDALHFRGEKKTDSTRLRGIEYNEEELNEYEFNTIEETLKHGSKDHMYWLNVDGVHDVDLLEELAAGLNMDKLIFADIPNTHARPELQEHGSCIYLSVKMLYYNEELNEVTSENLVLIIRGKLLITFQERVGDVFNPVRERLRKNRKLIRSSGPDYLAFALLDIVIDNYIHVISRLGEKIEALDDTIIGESSSDKLHEINKYKSEINYLRKVIRPCREMILNFVKLDSDLINEYMPVHLKELQSNIELARESVDSYTEILTDQLNIFHTNVTNKVNDILKFLTIFSVIFIPITFIAGIYGTNFDNIPELHYRYGYFMMWGVILAVVITMILYFKRKKWF